MIIDYCKDGEAVGDLSAKDYLRKKFKEYPDWHIHTSSECVILAARTLVVEGELPADKIKFWHEHKFVSNINEEGRLTHPPKDFCDFTLRCLGQILRGKVIRKLP
jgi:hypothetical protein